MRKLIIISISLILISCNQKDAIDSAETFPDKKLEVVVSYDQFVENGEIVAKLESNLHEFCKSSNLSVEKEPIDNRHVDNVVDTIKHFRGDKIYIQSYKATSEEWIVEAEIGDSMFEFSESINIGMTKKAFEYLIKTKIISDIIGVGNLEQTSVFIFTFKDNLLKKINFEGYVD